MSIDSFQRRQLSSEVRVGLRRQGGSRLRHAERRPVDRQNEKVGRQKIHGGRNKTISWKMRIQVQVNFYFSLETF